MQCSIFLKDLVHQVEAQAREEERNKFANEVIEAFGGIVPLSGEEALNLHLLAKTILELYEPKH